MADERMESTGASFLAGLLLGTLMGAAAATLLAPQPGTETRQMLAERSHLLRRRMERMASDMQEGLGEMTARVKGSTPHSETSQAAGPEGSAPPEPGANG